VAALYVDRGGGSLQTLPASDDTEVGEAAARALGALVADGRVRELVITKVDGQPVSTSSFRDRLLAAGFTAGYRGLVLRRPESSLGELRLPTRSDAFRSN
ncbi:MAG TPA: hypothetical protein VE640_01115, partial [Candidatus Bathyarchaeia archaeon]|nr:hypothetical protein [Candidatus Bathyarchaeia archaeon]